MMFRFASPVLLMLLAVVALWAFIRLRRPPVAIRHSMTSLFAAMGGSGSVLLGRIPVALRIAVLILLVLAAARPQLYNVSKDISTPGVDIMMCLDTSGSMRALDFKIDDKPVTRLTAVKKVVGEFIRKREMDRIGLIVFGAEAFTQCPLTLDKGLLLELVTKMEIGMAGDRTAVGSALAIGSKRLKDLKAPTKVLILLTDGRNNAGDIGPLEVAEAVGVLGVKIYTIGVGGKGPAPFRVQTAFGPRIVHQRVDLDEQMLMKIARFGQGKYFRATGVDELSQIYSLIDKLEKKEVKVKQFFHFRELYLFGLIPALILLGAEIILKTTFLRVLP
ncbi:MAG: VWA domain-containing protein [Desulfobacterales bacterium]|nr:VWA domain-containing protein [Desulfobacterales bacterium]